MDDTRLGDAVARWLELQRRGTAPPIDDWVALHPACGTELRDCLEQLAPAPRAAPPPEPPLPREFGDFTLTRVVGRGGMGVVYAAEQKSLRRRVALKVLPAGAMEPSLHARFLREVELTAKLRHPHIVEVLQAGEQDGVPWYAMPLLEGSSLDHVIAAWRDDPAGAPLSSGRELATWIARFADVARALAAAHAAGILHRDLKPSNLFLEVVDRSAAGSDSARRSNRLRLLDFGLARRSDGSGTLQTGTPIGTPRYMSPEQVVGESQLVDVRSDVYSLGATLYELVTLKQAITGSERESIYRAILLSDPKPPRQVDPRVPRDLENVILKALEKQPERRYATAGDFADDLQRFVDFQPVRARPIGFAGRLARRVRRNPVVAAALAVALLAVVAAVVAMPLQRARDAAERGRRAHERVAAIVAEAVRSRARVAAIEGELAELARMREPAAPRGPTWSLLDEKSAQLELDERRDALVAERDVRVDATLADLLRAMQLLPDDPEPARELRDFVTLAYRAAEKAHDGGRMARYRVFVEQFRGPLAGRVTLRVDPPDAYAWLFRHERRGPLLLPVPWAPGRGAPPGWLAARRLEGPWSGLEVTRVAGAVADDGRLRPGDVITRFCGFSPQNVAGIGHEIARVGSLHQHVVRRRRDDQWLDLALPARQLEALEGRPFEVDPFALERGEWNALAQDGGALELPVGSYLALVECDGHATARLPFVVGDGDALELAVALPETSELPDGFVVVPGGRGWLGGDADAADAAPGRAADVATFFIQRRETTVAEYVAFVEAIRRDDAAAAQQLIPTSPTRGVPMWSWVDGTRVIEPTLAAGFDDAYIEQVSMWAMDLKQIAAYCAWRTEELGDPDLEFDLPSAEEWERASRGADGRLFPWGDGFDWTFAKNALAAPLDDVGNPVEEPGGLFPFDVSVFGVRDTAAVNRELAREADGSLRLRGASWGLNEENAFHCASRGNFALRNLRQSGLGFRLVLRRRKQ